MPTPSVRLEPPRVRAKERAPELVSAPFRLRSLLALIAVLAMITAVMAFTLPAAPVSTPAAPAPAVPAAPDLSRMGVSFTANAGQTDPRVAFTVASRDATAFFTTEGLTWRMHRGDRTPWVLRQAFVGANPVRPEGDGQLPGVVSFFKGSPEEWVTGAATFSGITYRNLWDGIDLSYRVAEGGLKYEFLVHPGADPGDIRIRYEGATPRLAGDGSLRAGTPGGPLVDGAPVSFQTRGGSVHGIDSAYTLGSGGTVGFSVGAYDLSRPLVIDPYVQVYSGFIGGAAIDIGTDVEVDASGAAYVAGETTSAQTTFPETVGPDLTINGTRDAFIAKVAPDGASLVYAGYIGGSGDDLANGVAVDASGAAYVVGSASSTQATFPEVGGPDLTHNGLVDGFVAKVAPSGASLVYAGYIGGAAPDSAIAVAVDAAGAAYVSGSTDSTEATFPEAVGPDLTHNGIGDGFVAKVAPTGATLAYAGYIGGVGLDTAFGAAVDAAGALYVSGTTSSAEATFPEVVGPDLTYNGMADGFVAKVVPTGASLAYAGYIGGADDELARDAAVDATGALYVTGITLSDETTFPATVGPDLFHNGGDDAFAAKVVPGGASLAYAGFIGGTVDESGIELALESSGAVWVTGVTTSTQADGLPLGNWPDLTYNGSNDAFVSRVAPGGTHLTNSGYLGGSGLDLGFGIDVDAANAVYVTGVTASSELNFPVRTGPDTTFNGGEDAFITKFADEVAPPSPGSGDADLSVNKTDVADPVQVGRTIRYTITVSNAGPDPATEVSVKDALPVNTDLFSATPSSGSCSVAGTTVTCQLGSIASGASKTVDLRIKPRRTGTVVNTASASTDDDDPNGANNSGSASTTVVPNSAGCTIVGTPASETINGTAGADVICADAGDDTVNGTGGDDDLRGQEGNDVLIGGPGDDTLNGGAGDDTLSGREDQDLLIGATGFDTLSGNGGDDELRGGIGEDSLTGGKGSDKLFGDQNSDTLRADDGVSGNDTLNGGSEPDSCRSDTGDTETSCET